MEADKNVADATDARNLVDEYKGLTNEQVFDTFRFCYDVDGVWR